MFFLKRKPNFFVSPFPIIHLYKKKMREKMKIIYKEKVFLKNVLLIFLQKQK